MSTTAWLIESRDTGMRASNTQYYCGPTDWCNNANHAAKFETKLEAMAVIQKLAKSPMFETIAVEHSWI